MLHNQTVKEVRLVRFVIKFIRLFYHKIVESEMFLRAGALTYVTIFSVVPFLAFSTSVIKGLGGYKTLKTNIYSILSYYLYGDEKIMDLVDKVFFYVERTNFATLGFLGAFGILWAVISVFSNIESALNAVWSIRKKRPWIRRITDYTAISILFPLSVNALMISSTVIKGSYFTLVLKVIPFLLLVFSLFVMYQFIPLVGIGYVSNLIGAFFGAFMWMVVQFLYFKLQIGVSSYNAIYGSFVALPLFMMFVYFSWVSFLLGSIVSYIYENKALLFDESDPSDLVTPINNFFIAKRVLDLVYEKFSVSCGVSKKDIVKNLKVPIFLIDSVTTKLLSAGYLVLSSDGLFYPALPRENLKLEEVLEVFIGKVNGNYIKLSLEVNNGQD